MTDLGTHFPPNSRIYHAEEWPWGLRCSACHEEFVEDQPLAERLEAFQDDIPILVITCVGCDLSGASTDA